MEHLRSVSAGKGIVWLCGECTDAFAKWKEISTKPTIPVAETVSSEIVDLKTKVDAIIATLTSITQNNVSSSPVIRHSTPVSYSQLSNGIRTETNSSSTADFSGVEADPMLHTDRNFALLLTNIHNTVSGRDIQQMVSRSLGSSNEFECCSVKKLVPEWVDSNTLDYISFKVVLSEKWKTIAMCPSTWPEGIKFREFVRRRKTWNPNMEHYREKR